MSYQNIDEQNFKQILGQQLGQVEGILRSKIKTALKVLINKFKQRVIDNATGILTERLAPNVCDRTNDIQNGIEAINGFLFEIQDKVYLFLNPYLPVLVFLLTLLLNLVI